MKDNTEKITEKGLSILKSLFLHPQEALALIGTNRYKSLRVRLFFIIGALAGVPLILVILIGFVWLRDILDDNFNVQLKWQIESTEKSLEMFLGEKISGLKFLTSAHSFDELSQQRGLSEIFTKRKKEFAELVDLGVIDNKGVQRAYSGPYDLLGKDYANQDWFQKVIVRGVYVSDVFLGYRNTPHFAIAVKQEMPEKNSFWVLRATIDVDTLTHFISSIMLKENDDAFIINTEGILQTPSRFHGKLLDHVAMSIVPPRQDALQIQILPWSDDAVFGYASIKQTPWILGVVIKSSSFGRLLEIFQREKVAVYVIVVLIVFGIILNYRTARRVVNWIEEADRRREEAISQTEHSAKLASVGRLAAGVAHEINNPLAVINEKAGLMQDMLEFSPEVSSCKEKFAPLLSGIVDNINRCRTITHRLLGFARRMDVKIEGIDINDAIKEVSGFLEREILYRDIHLELNLNEHLPMVQSDRGQIQQVFLNIINNAIDAVDDGGIITVSTVPDDGFIRVIVRDNGEGIPREVMKHIFEPFYTTKEKGKGTGLGLSLSYGIMQRLGGTIQVDSIVSKGTTFTIKIPVNTDHSTGVS
ncbi:MAG TPA: ATP-binding protein [Dissulfurispiraceae bacterium]|nr:ATP-binding protein [Dissulfurispiraceae bacterium]